MSETVNWSGDSCSLHEGAAASLRAGRLLLVPTECGYEGAALGRDADAVARLTAVSDPGSLLTVALQSPIEVFDWIPGLRGPALRLIRDYWPGPLTLVASTVPKDSLFWRLPRPVQAAVDARGGLALRCCDRDDLAPLLRGVDGPVVFASAPRMAAAPEAAAPEVGSPAFDLILNGGLTPILAPPTVVRVEAGAAEIVREGAIPASYIADSIRSRVVFICTGNTCRSPLAEALCRRLLADTLGRDLEEVARRFDVVSAGMAAVSGAPASPETVVIAQSYGVDLSGHQSRPLDLDLMARADHLFTMTGNHLRMLLAAQQSLRKPVGPTPTMLSPGGEDVPDPIGGPEALYLACAEQIQRFLRQRLAQILEG